MQKAEADKLRRLVHLMVQRVERSAEDHHEVLFYTLTENTDQARIDLHVKFPGAG